MKFSTLTAFLALSPIAVSQVPTECPAILKGHAVLDANTTVPIPIDAPQQMNITGRFTGDRNERVEELGAIKQATGYDLPMVAEPIQGISGIYTIKDSDGNPSGAYWVISDNGFGTKKNSADVLLKALRIRPDFATGEVAYSSQNIIHFRDPDRLLPFPITNENTQQRYLTGMDLDPESIQQVGTHIYIGDEFGPYILKFDIQGVLVDVYNVPSPFQENKSIYSPDSSQVELPSNILDGIRIVYEVQRSGGIEGLAQAINGTKLYPIMEKPMFDYQLKAYEMDDSGQPYVRIFEMDEELGSISNSGLKYKLEGDHSVRDFSMVSENLGIVIETDSSEGDPRLQCSTVESDPCFEEVADFKRIYLISLNETDNLGFVKKLAYVDLLNIQDPDGVAKTGTLGDRFTFPFQNIAALDVVDNNTIIVANDNDFPFSSGRTASVQDNNEFIQLDVKEFLAGGLNC